jgi:hypothetical protein
MDFQNIYCLNLLVYINAKLVVLQDFKMLLAELEKTDPDGVFISISDDIKKLDPLMRLRSLTKDKAKKPIMIVQGIKESPYEEIIAFSREVEVKELVQTFAKKFGITSAFMASQKMDQHYPLPAKYILPGWQAIYPVLIKDEQGKLISLLKEKEFFTKVLLDKIKTQDIYVQADLRLEFVNMFTKGLGDLLSSKTLSDDQRVEQTDLAFNMISQSFTTVGLPETSMVLAKKSIESMESLIDSVKSLKGLYDILTKNKATYRFKHSILSCHLGLFILQKQPWANKNHLAQWTYLCYFHDLSLTTDEQAKVHEESEYQTSKIFSPDEKMLIKNHAQMASKILSQIKELPMGLDVLVKQHHGAKMGDSLKVSMSVSVMSILFILVEGYTQFILSGNEVKKTPDMINKFIEGMFKKYPYPNYRKMIPLLRDIPINY